MARRALAALLLLGLLGVAAGCGEEGGATDGATVTVYVSAPLRGDEAQAGRTLCDEAREQAAQGKGDDALKLRIVCLDAAGGAERWTLAQVGANARQATEDSTAIAYVGELAKVARRQSHTILDAAGIAQIGNASGREAISQVQAALREDEQSDPRDAVFDALG